MREPISVVRPDPPSAQRSASDRLTAAVGRSAARIVPLAFAAALILVLAALPALKPGYRFLSVATSTGISTIALYGLAILFGQAGIMSVGHAALMGVGAYTGAILARSGIGFWPALPLAAVLSAGIAGLLGLPSLRVSGHHFVIITFAFCGLLTIILINGGTFTGAATGLDIGSIEPLFGINFGTLQNTYYLVLFFVALSILLTRVIIVSRYGRTLRSIRENEPLARSVGIDTGLHKIGAFMLSGAFAGVAGILQAYFLAHISPELYGAFPSIYLSLMVMLGGARALFGPLGGAIIVYFLPEILKLDPVDSRIAYGIGLIAVILLLPSGVIAGAAAIFGKLARRFSQAT
ncbi:MAG: branched-chain amino acid ABC transporter permease [Methylobacteriaceae bacterium]|nr:branched-chain amino acid ABC transporter permease [Methylobacteriaceae bacterium]